MEVDTIVVGDCLDVMAGMPRGSVHCSVTSPAYYGLRRYSGAQECEWPAVEYAPLPGMPPIRIAGCDPECEHEWGKDLPPPHPGQVEQTKWKNAEAAGQGQTTPCGNYCQKCGGWRGALGHEPSIEAYIGHLVAIYREMWRVLRDDGVAWIVMGDSFSTSPPGKKPSWSTSGLHGAATSKQYQETLNNSVQTTGDKLTAGLAQGNLMLVPHRLALALQADGWTIRNDVVFAKVAPMPESVAGWRWQRHRIKVKNGPKKRSGKDKAGLVGSRNDIDRLSLPGSPMSTYPYAEYELCPGCPKCSPHDGFVLRRGSWRHTRAHEFVFMLTKGMGYWSDQEQVKEAASSFRRQRSLRDGGNSRKGFDSVSLGLRGGVPKDNYDVPYRNPRSVLSLPPEPFPGPHFAVFPTSLISPLIRATCPTRCCPQCGRGWSPTIRQQRYNTRPGHISKIREDAGEVSLRNDTQRLGFRPMVNTDILGHRPSCDCWRKQVPDGPVPFVPMQKWFDQLDWQPGLVFDPFMGSGRTAVVAVRLGLHYYGCDISADYVEMAKAEVAKEKVKVEKAQEKARLESAQIEMFKQC